MLHTAPGSQGGGNLWLCHKPDNQDYPRLLGGLATLFPVDTTDAEFLAAVEEVVAKTSCNVKVISWCLTVRTRCVPVKPSASQHCSYCVRDFMRLGCAVLRHAAQVVVMQAGTGSSAVCRCSSVLVGPVRHAAARAPAMQRRRRPRSQLRGTDHRRQKRARATRVARQLLGTGASIDGVTGTSMWRVDIFRLDRPACHRRAVAPDRNSAWPRSKCMRLSC